MRILTNFTHYNFKDMTNIGTSHMVVNKVCIAIVKKGNIYVDSEHEVDYQSSICNNIIVNNKTIDKFVFRGDNIYVDIKL